MENSGYKVVSNRSDQRKKFLIAFVSFAFTLAFVIAVFSLTLGRRTVDWMDGTAGYSRAAAFPYPFISGSSLYVLRNDRSYDEIDNNVKNAVFDPAVDSVYYVYEPTSELYEYSVGDKTRVKLCSGVDSFSLFKNRTHVAFSTESGDICVYSYNSKSVSVLRGGGSGGSVPADGSLFYVGVSSIFYFDDFDAEGGTATLKQWKMSGSVSTVSESVLYSSGVTIWKNDEAVSFYTKSGLSICPKDGSPVVIGENFAQVLPGAYDHPDICGDVVRSFDTCVPVRYLSCTDPDKGLSLYSVSVSSGKVKFSPICEGVKEIVGYDDASEVIVFTADKNGSDLSVFKSQKGGKAQELFLTEADSELFFEPSSHCVYITSKDDSCTRVDIYDKAKTKYLVSNDAKDLTAYFRKPFAVFSDSAETTKTIVINRNIRESYSISETRLYGKSDSVYLLLRGNGISDRVSLDYASSGVLKRISGDCFGESVVFDKKLENVIYYSGGALYVFTGDQNYKVGTFAEKTVPVPVCTY